jgi:hypothetical protein
MINDMAMKRQMMEQFGGAADYMMKQAKRNQLLGDLAGLGGAIAGGRSQRPGSAYA